MSNLAFIPSSGRSSTTDSTSTLSILHRPHARVCAASWASGRYTTHRDACTSRPDEGPRDISKMPRRAFRATILMSILSWPAADCSLEILALPSSAHDSRFWPADCICWANAKIVTAFLRHLTLRHFHPPSAKVALTSSAKRWPAGSPASRPSVGDAAILIGDTGRSFLRTTLTSLAAAWSNLLEKSSSERVSLSAAARRRIEQHFSLDVVRERYMSFYERFAQDERQS